MWWLPVLGWAIALTIVFVFAWFSMAKFRYYDSVKNAKIMGTKIPDKPWYVKIFD